MRKSRAGRGEGRYVVPLPDTLKPAAIGSHWTAAGLAFQYGYGFCEGCQQSRPKPRRRPNKGWRCNHCTTKEI